MQEKFQDTSPGESESQFIKAYDKESKITCLRKELLKVEWWAGFLCPMSFIYSL